METIFSEKQEAHIREAAAAYVQAVAERKTALAHCQTEALAERVTQVIRLLLDKAGLRHEKIHATASSFAYQGQSVDRLLLLRLENGEPRASKGNSTIEAHNTKEFLRVRKTRQDAAHIVTAEASILGKQGFKDADTTATLASLKKSGGTIKVDEAGFLSPEDAEQLIEMAKLMRLDST
jgi:hypothetical protein